MWRLVYRTIESWAASLSPHVVQYNHISRNTLKRLTNLFIHEDRFEDGAAALLVNVRRHLDEIEQLYVHVASNYNKYGELHWGTAYSFELDSISEMYIIGYDIFGDDFDDSLWAYHYFYGQDWQSNSDMEAFYDDDNGNDDNDNDDDNDMMNE